MFLPIFAASLHLIKTFQGHPSDEISDHMSRDICTCAKDHFALHCCEINVEVRTVQHELASKGGKKVVKELDRKVQLSLRALE